MKHDKENSAGATDSKDQLMRSRKLRWILLAVLLFIAVGLGVGLGVGLTRKSGVTESGPDPNESSPPISKNTTVTTGGNFWRPESGATWQIVIAYALNDTSLNVSVYDIDLFTNSESVIQNLHSEGRKVICYFSAGSYEDFRPDSGDFKAKDYAKPLVGWQGEWWLDTNSANVRNIMSQRLKLAKSKGCDGVDPDNVDGYDNDTGLGLTTSDAVDYLTFLATEAHGLNMSIGLKNAGVIVNQTLAMMEWEVNEDCLQFGECGLFQPFIDAGKPVFHIEYPKGVQSLSESEKDKICDDDSVKGFSTVLKELELNNFVKYC